MKQKSLPLPPLYSCGMNFKISKFNNHFSQQLNSKAEKKKTVKKHFACLPWKIGNILLTLRTVSILYKCLYSNNKLWDVFEFSYEYSLCRQRSMQ